MDSSSEPDVDSRMVTNNCNHESKMAAVVRGDLDSSILWENTRDSTNTPSSHHSEEMAAISLMTLEARALSNHIIRREILYKYLGKVDLISCRLVGRDWYVDATGWLLNLSKFGKGQWMSFDYDQENGNSYFTYYGRTLQDFCTFMGTGDSRRSSRHLSDNKMTRFPCTSYSFRGGNLCWPDSKVFFTTPEILVQCLYLNFRYGKTHLETLQWVLVRCGPTLRYLCMFGPIYLSTDASFYSDIDHRMDDPNEGSQKAVELPQFPSLERLNVNGLYTYYDPFPMAIISHILRTAPKLKVIQDDLCYYYDVVVMEKKIGAVKKWIFDPSFLERYIHQPWSGLWRHPPRLKVLGIKACIDDLCFSPSSSHPSMASVVQKVIEESRDSLRIIFHFLPLIFYSKLCWPPLKNLRTLVLAQTLRDQDRHVTASGADFCGKEQQPPHQKLATIFPNVCHLGVDQEMYSIRQDEYAIDRSGGFGQSSNFGESWMGSLIDLLDPLVTISEVSFGCRLTPNWIHTVGRLCPNVRSIRWHQDQVDQHLPKVLQALWLTWPLVEVIKFNFPKGLPVPLCSPHFTREVDAAVTGLDPRTCEMLEMNPNYLVSPQELYHKTSESDRSSILNLKKLQLFELKFAQKANIPQDLHTPVFSRVSFNYGFDVLTRRQEFRLQLWNSAESKASP